MKLSEHFTYEEFIKSDTATRYGIKNEPSATVLNTMKHTCNYLLEPLRALLNEHYKCTVTITITSGFRCLGLNRKIGSKDTSEHILGQACDIECKKVIDGKRITIPYTELYTLIKGWVKAGKLSVNQCIQERSGNATWVHISHSAWGKTRDKKQFLKFVNGVYTLDK